MSRYDLRFAVRHPLAWLASWWLHVVVASLLAGLAVVWTNPMFDRVLQSELWPIGTGAVAALVLASALAPWERRLVAVTGAALIALGVLRALALAEVAYNDQEITVLAVSLGIHGLVLAALGVVWPDWTVACAARATVDAGHDDRGKPDV